MNNNCDRDYAAHITLKKSKNESVPEVRELMLNDRLSQFCLDDSLLTDIIYLFA